MFDLNSKDDLYLIVYGILNKINQEKMRMPNSPNIYMFDIHAKNIYTTATGLATNLASGATGLASSLYSSFVGSSSSLATIQDSPMSANNSEIKTKEEEEEVIKTKEEARVIKIKNYVYNSYCITQQDLYSA